MCNLLNASIFFLLTIPINSYTQSLFLKGRIISDSHVEVLNTQICLIANEMVMKCELTDSCGNYFFFDLEGCPDQYTLVVLNKKGSISFERDLEHLTTGGTVPTIMLEAD